MFSPRHDRLFLYTILACIDHNIKQQQTDKGHIFVCVGNEPESNGFRRRRSIVLERCQNSVCLRLYIIIIHHSNICNIFNHIQYKLTLTITEVHTTQPKRKEVLLDCR